MVKQENADLKDKLEEERKTVRNQVIDYNLGHSI